MNNAASSLSKTGRSIRGKARSAADVCSDWVFIHRCRRTFRVPFPPLSSIFTLNQKMKIPKLRAFDDISKTRAYDRLDFSRPQPVSCLEIWVLDDETTDFRHMQQDADGKILGCTFFEWVSQSEPYVQPQDQYNKDFRGGLRLVVHRVPDPSFSSGQWVPFHKHGH
jgi:hypothetical protein